MHRLASVNKTYFFVSDVCLPKAAHFLSGSMSPKLKKVSGWAGGIVYCTAVVCPIAIANHGSGTCFSNNAVRLQLLLSKPAKHTISDGETNPTTSPQGIRTPHCLLCTSFASPHALVHTLHKHTHAHLAQRSICRWPPLAAFPQVSEFQGHPFPLAHLRMSRWPMPAALLQV